MVRFKDLCVFAGNGEEMPHDNVPLAQAPNGEIGPLCHDCGIRMTFGSAMVHNNYYLCWKCYVVATGADSATEVSNTNIPFWQQRDE